MPRHVDWEILVHLDRSAVNEVGHKDDYFKAVEDRYASKYCVELGVEPLPHHKSTIARLAPLADCEFESLWADSSAVASRISIMQPNLSSVHESRAVHTSMSAAQRQAEWFGRASYMNVSPPAPPKEVAAHFDLGAQSKAKALATQSRTKAHAFASMKLQDLVHSGKNDSFQVLTDELERARVKARSDLEDMGEKADVFGRLLKTKGRREQDEKELENLKTKFLLPFACEREGSAQLLPWQSPELKTRPEIYVHDDFLADAKKPIALTMFQMEEECWAYTVSRFPVELLTTRADAELFAAIKEQLITEEAVRLVGLLSHFLYWIVLEHIHEPAQRLPEQSRQSLVLTIQELWSMIQAPARQRLGRRGELLTKDGPAGISFVLPAFMLALKRGVEWCFSVCHPWIFAEASTTTQLIDQINILFMRLFDPDNLYASFGSLEASQRAIRLWHKLSILQASMGVTPARRIITQEYRTTPLMSLLMTCDGGNPSDPKTRQLLARSASESIISSPKQDPNKPPERCELESWRRSALYRSASKRLNGLQKAGLETAAGKSASITEKAKGGFMKSKSSIRSKRSRSGTHTRSSEMTSTAGSESNATIHTML